MRITAQTDLLRDALAAVKPAARITSNVPAVGAIHMIAAGNTLTLQAVTFDLWARTTVPIATEADGAALIPQPENLMQWLRLCTAPTVELATTGNTLVITAGTQAAQFATISVSNAIAPPWPDNTQPQGALRVKPDAVRSCLPCVSPRDPREALRGIHLCISDGWLYCEATDGKGAARAACYAVEDTDALPQEGVVAPAGFLSAAVAGELLSLIVCGDTITATDGATSLGTRAIAAKWPPLDKVFEPTRQQGRDRFTVGLADLIGAIEVACIASHGPQTHSVVIDCDGAGTATVSSSVEACEITTTIPCDAAEPYRVACDGPMWLPRLKAFEAMCQTATLSSWDGSGPQLMRPHVWAHAIPAPEAIYMPLKITKVAPQEEEGSTHADN